jgi:hypothetical protein
MGQPAAVVLEETHFKIYKWSWNDRKYDSGSQTGLETKINSTGEDRQQIFAL